MREERIAEDDVGVPMPFVPPLFHLTHLQCGDPLQLALLLEGDALFLGLVIEMTPGQRTEHGQTGDDNGDQRDAAGDGRGVHHTLRLLSSEEHTDGVCRGWWHGEWHRVSGCHGWRGNGTVDDRMVMNCSEKRYRRSLSSPVRTVCEDGTAADVRMTGRSGPAALSMRTSGSEEGPLG